MQITDSIGDMLTRIRNANSAKHETVSVPASNMRWISNTVPTNRLSSPVFAEYQSPVCVYTQTVRICLRS